MSHQRLTRLVSQRRETGAPPQNRDSMNLLDKFSFIIFMFTIPCEELREFTKDLAVLHPKDILKDELGEIVSGGRQMRTDVKTLLDRMGRSQFKYKEFSDRFSELETWPVFEAVIRDPRVFENSANNSSIGLPQSDSQAPSIGSVLSGKYRSDDSARAENPGGDVRGLLARISSAAKTGLI